MRLKYRDITRFKYEVAESFYHQTMIMARACHTDFISLDDNGMLVIAQGYKWDGPSGPTIDTDCGMRGSLVHDALYELMRRSLLESFWREYADDLLGDICIEDGMSEFRADLWYSSVRAFAGPCAKFGTQPEDIVYTAGKE